MEPITAVKEVATVLEELWRVVSWVIPPNDKLPAERFDTETLSRLIRALAVASCAVREELDAENAVLESCCWARDDDNAALRFERELDCGIRTKLSASLENS